MERSCYYALLRLLRERAVQRGSGLPPLRLRGGPAQQSAATASLPALPALRPAFLIPAIGAIVYLLKYQQYPIQAKSLGKWALIGFALRTAASVLLFIFFFTLSFLGSMRW